MILTTHILAGAAIGSKVHNYWLVAALSIVSHFVLDFFPHNEYGINGLKNGRLNKAFTLDFLKVAVDGIVGFFVATLLFSDYQNFGYVFVGMIFAVLPDFILFLSYIFDSKILNAIKKAHSGYVHFLKDKKIPAYARVGIQVVIAIICMAIISI